MWVTLHSTPSTNLLADPARRVSVNLHKCSRHAVLTENVQREMRSYKSCRFSQELSTGAAVVWPDARCLTVLSRRPSHRSVIFFTRTRRRMSRPTSRCASRAHGRSPPRTSSRSSEYGNPMTSWMTSSLPVPNGVTRGPANPGSRGVSQSASLSYRSVILFRSARTIASYRARLQRVPARSGLACDRFHWPVRTWPTSMRWPSGSRM